jgi:hypothetical protein
MDGDLVSNLDVADGRAYLHYLTGRLVPHDQGQRSSGEFAGRDLKIGAAKAASGDSDQRLTGAKLRQRNLPPLQWFPKPFKHHRSHLQRSFLANDLPLKLEQFGRVFAENLFLVSLRYAGRAFDKADRLSRAHVERIV